MILSFNNPIDLPSLQYLTQHSVHNFTHMQKLSASIIPQAL